jgi:arginyl-tRNA synthetase
LWINKELTTVALSLPQALKQVIDNGLNLLMIEPLEKM